MHFCFMATKNTCVLIMLRFSTLDKLIHMQPFSPSQMRFFRHLLIRVLGVQALLDTKPFTSFVLV